MNETNRAYGPLGSGGLQAANKTATEALTERLLATAQRMATHNDTASASLDRLIGGDPQRASVVGGSPAETPRPVDFVGHAQQLLDRIGGELERMESNSARLARLA